MVKQIQSNEVVNVIAKPVRQNALPVTSTRESTLSTAYR